MAHDSHQLWRCLTRHWPPSLTSCSRRLTRQPFHSVQRDGDFALAYTHRDGVVKCCLGLLRAWRFWRACDGVPARELLPCAPDDLASVPTVELAEWFWASGLHIRGECVSVWPGGRSAFFTQGQHAAALQPRHRPLQPW